MSLESLGALRQLVQVREQNQTIQNDNLEQIQGSIQQVGVAESQRVDQLNLEKAKATYEVALAQATVERIQSQLQREMKAETSALFATVLTGALAGADAYMNLSKDLNGGQKLKDANSGSGVDAINKKNAKVIGGDINGNNIYIGSSVKNEKTDGVTYSLFNKENGSLDTDKAIKAGFLTKGADGSFSATALGKEKGFSVINSENPDGSISSTINLDKTKGVNENSRFVDQDMAIKYGMAIRDQNGGLVTTDKGEFYGLGKSGDALSSTAKDGLDINMKSETILRATTSGDKAQIAYFSAATISEDDIRLKAEQKGINLNGVFTFEALNKADPKAAEELFNERGHDIKGVEAVDAQNAFKFAVRENAKELKNNIDKNPTTEKLTPEEIKSQKTGIDNRVKELTGSLEDKLLTEGKTNMGISGKDKAKYVWNALVSVADTVVPQLQAYMAARDRVAKTEIELAAAMEKLAAAQKKLKALEDLIISVGAGDQLGIGNNTNEKGL
jgi:hypothetical protein